MPIYQALLLAIIQGLTEFLPISSSAHLALAPWLLGWQDQGLNFDLALHLGTLAAVLIYFFRDWLQIAAQGFGIRWGSDQDLRKQPKMLWMLAVASLPIGIFGFLLKSEAENGWRAPLLMGTMLVAVGILMAIGERVGTHRKSLGGITWLDGIIIGFAQALAIVPGTSRSGITITAGLFRDIDRAAAARFSFLLSTPAVVAASAKAAYDVYKAGGIAPGMHLPFFVGILGSAVTGCLVIAYLLRFLRRHSLTFFVYYRIVFGIIVIALALFRANAK